MKIIISHDVDHITVWEHRKDLIIPKFIMRSLIEFTLAYTSTSEIRNRFKEFVRNKWQNIEELMEFDKKNKIPSTFFIAVANGIGLSYSLKNTEFWIKKILQGDFKVGIHSIAFGNYDNMKKEYTIFKNLSGLEKFGMRMHYLRLCKNTLGFLNKTGYLFDSTLYRNENPFKTGNLWEFPLHIMDGYTFYENSRWQNQTLEQAKDKTKIIIKEACKKGIKYFTILFHDRYFSNSFKSWKDWYIWVIDYLKNSEFKFTSYREAIQELEKKV